MSQNFVEYVIDNMFMSFIYLVNKGRNLCDTFINKSAFMIKSIKVYIDNDHHHSLDVKSNELYYDNINTFMASYDIPIVLTDKDYWIEIMYYYGEIRYRIIYNKWNKIHFPPYTLEEINASNKFKMEIIYAEYNKEDITSLLKEYVGPMRNFYHDKDLHITPKQICRNNVDNNEILITDNNADDYYFKDNDKICLKI